MRSLESGVLGSGFWSLESGVLVWGLGVLEAGVPNFEKHETMALGLLDQVGYVRIDCISELERPFHHMVSFLSENVGKSLLGVSLDTWSRGFQCAQGTRPRGFQWPGHLAQGTWSMKPNGSHKQIAFNIMIIHTGRLNGAVVYTIRRLAPIPTAEPED